MFVARMLNTTGVCFQRPRKVLAKLHAVEAGEPLLNNSEHGAYSALANVRNCAGAMIGSITGGKVGWLLDQVIQHNPLSLAGVKETFLFPLAGIEHVNAVSPPFFTSLFAAMSSVYWNHPNGGDLKGLCREVELSVARRLANSGDWLQHTARRWLTP